MELNTIYYGDITEDTHYPYNYVNKLFNPQNYPINTKLDFSITATASSSSFAPFNNISYFSPYSPEFGAKYFNGTKDLQKLVLATSFQRDNWAFRLWYKQRYGYGITEYTNFTEPVKLICGYNFLSIYAVLYLIYGNGSLIAFDKYKYDLHGDIIGAILVTRNDISQNSSDASYHFFEIDDLQGSTYTLNNNNEITDNMNNYLFYRGVKTFERRYMPLIGMTSRKSEYSAITNKNEMSSYYIFNSDLCEISVDGTTLKCVIPQSRKEKILNIAATIGIPFITNDDFDYTQVTNDNVSFDELYIPTIENNGLYNGYYTHGNDNKKQKQIVENWNVDRNAPYIKGVKDFDNIDNNKYTDKMVKGAGRQSGQFNNAYLITNDKMKKLQKLLNVKSIDDTTPEIYKNLLFMGSNPMDCITSIQWFPVKPPSTGNTSIILGSYTTDITAKAVENFTLFVNMGFCDIKPIHENHYFLNFEPYSYYLLYAPFCGWYPLDSKKVVGKTIQLYMNIDFLAGTCSVEVWVNDCLETVLNGIISAPVSVQAFSQNDYFNSRINSVKNIGSDIISASNAIGGNIMSKSPSGFGIATSAVGGALNLAGDIFSFVRPEMRYNSITANTANLSTYNPILPYIARYTVTEQIPQNYNSTIGYACEFTANVNTLSGFTVFSNFNCDGISATDTEKAEIKALAENGIYI